MFQKELVFLLLFSITLFCLKPLREINFHSLSFRFHRFQTKWEDNGRKKKQQFHVAQYLNLYSLSIFSSNQWKEKCNFFFLSFLFHKFQTKERKEKIFKKENVEKKITSTCLFVFWLGFNFFMFLLSFHCQPNGRRIFSSDKKKKTKWEKGIFFNFLFSISLHN